MTQCVFGREGGGGGQCLSAVSTKNSSFLSHVHSWGISARWGRGSSPGDKT